MKPRSANTASFLVYSQWSTVRPLCRPQRRYAASASSSPPSPPPHGRRWMRLALVSIAAAAAGAYLRSQQNPNSQNTLNPAWFTPYYLASKESVSSTGSIFTLKPPKPDGSNRAVYDEAWKTGVWSVMFKQPQLQIGRDYTPLPSVSTGEEEDVLRFFIRRDPFGEVSRYLHSLDVGTPIEIRGPRIECPVPSDTQQVLFIAGGTGIAPALQAGHTLLRRTSSTHKPRIHILWANRRREDCLGGVNDTTTTKPQRSWFPELSLSRTSNPTSAPPSTGSSSSTTHVSPMVRALEALKSQYPGQITVDYYVDEENAFIEKKAILEFTKSTSSSNGSSPRNMILVSGPEGFISYMAGPKQWAQGMELQGPLDGIIRELDLKDWTVWKL